MIKSSENSSTAESNKSANRSKWLIGETRIGIHVDRLGHVCGARKEEEGTNVHTCNEAVAHAQCWIRFNNDSRRTWLTCALCSGLQEHDANLNTFVRGSRATPKSAWSMKHFSRALWSACHPLFKQLVFVSVLFCCSLARQLSLLLGKTTTAMINILDRWGKLSRKMFK